MALAGTGLPGNENTHEVAQRIAPGSRVVYVDNDPLVMAHARALLTGVTQDRTGYIDADLNDPERIISITAPSHIQALRVYEQTGAVPYHLRSPEQIIRFFAGLEAAPPGIVPVQQWRPDQRSSLFPADINMWGGVAVKR